MVKSLSYAAQNLRLIYRAPHPCPVLDALHGMQSHLLAHMNAESLGWFTSIPRVEQHLWEACCDLLRVVRVTLTVPGPSSGWSGCCPCGCSAGNSAMLSPRTRVKSN